MDAMAEQTATPVPPGSDAPRTSFGLVDGMIRSLTEIVGDQAGSALFRFAAQKEGERLGAGYSAARLDEALARLDAMLEQTTTLKDNSAGRILLEVRSPLLEGEGSGPTILVALLEGLAGKVMGPRYAATLVRQGDHATIELREEQND